MNFPSEKALRFHERHAKPFSFGKISRKRETNVSEMSYEMLLLIMIRDVIIIINQRCYDQDNKKIIELYTKCTIIF